MKNRDQSDQASAMKELKAENFVQVKGSKKRKVRPARQSVQVDIGESDEEEYDEDE